MKLVSITALLYLLCSCNCHYYNPNKRQTETPIFVIGKGYLSHVCDETDDEIRLQFYEEERSYKLANNSIGHGYTASVNFFNSKNRPNLIVGAGSEFEVGQCRFRVVKVFNPRMLDSVTNTVTGEYSCIYNKLAI